MNKNRTYFKWWLNKFHKPIIRHIYRHFYLDIQKDICKSILVAGTARSGTTWLAEIIDSQIPCRIMFEPFHSKKVKEFRRFNYFQYMRPYEENEALLNSCQTLFTGDIRDKWIDRQIVHFLPRYRLIKEIRANLFLKWINNRFPELPIFFIIRHPCAVAFSRMQLAWSADLDIASFLSQNKLIIDFLSDKLDLIKGAKTEEQKHAVIWCISNLIPLKQFGVNQLKLIFYENLCTNPKNEVKKIFKSIQVFYQDSLFKFVDKPSLTTTKDSAVISGTNRVIPWQQNLSTRQITNILAIVQEFGLDYLYEDSPLPQMNQL
jgi:hypothetical protein